MEKVKTSKYNFKDATLVKDFPDYLLGSLQDWFEVMVFDNELYDIRFDMDYLNSEFTSLIELSIRETINRNVDGFFAQFSKDTEKMLKVLDVLLEKYGNITIRNDSDRKRCGKSFGQVLEDILKPGSLAYTAVRVGGKWGLYYRVSDFALKNAKEARAKDSSLEEAWKACYGVSPNYNKVVTESINCIENVLKTNYFPKDNKPQIGKFITQLKNNATDLTFLGADTLGQHGREALELIKNLSKYRGMHKSGTGQDATREIAIYALNTAIWFWNLHNQK